MSLDRSGRARSLEEQHADHVRVAGEQGWVLDERAYRDESVSASRYSRKAREGFDALIEDLTHDRLGAQVLMIWESSRGSRRVGEWADLLELCERRSVSIFVTTHGRCYEPGNGRDRRSLLEDAVDSEYESSKISTRVRRAAAANAVAGRPHGRIPYGYRRVFDPTTRAFLVQEPEPDEAAVVSELYRRLVQGHSLRAIARDLQTCGIRTRSGLVWTAQHLRSLVIKPVYAGLRSHNPGRRGGDRLVDLDCLYEGQWTPLVSRADWFAVQRLLRSPQRKTTRPGRAKHLLSMIGRCGVCRGTLNVAYRDSQSLYVCGTNGCVRITQTDLDTLAERVMLDYLAQPDVLATLRAGDEQGDRELSQVQDRLAAVRARHEQLADAVAAGTVSVATLIRAEPTLLVEITKLETREKELSTPSALRGLIEPGADVARRWDAAPISTRREIARLLLTPEFIGELRLNSSPRRGRHRTPAHERIQWWRG
ncbi:MAG: recombinase family protein [Actinomycetota bacterium]|nr:recombinase family protein [Actinomycetota bacterium]